MAYKRYFLRFFTRKSMLSVNQKKFINRDEMEPQGKLVMFKTYVNQFSMPFLSPNINSIRTTHSRDIIPVLLTKKSSWHTPSVGIKVRERPDYYKFMSFAYVKW